MTFELRLSREAGEDLQQIYLQLYDFAPEVADRIVEALMSASAEICETPHRWTYFRLAGAPRRARLIKHGRIAVWIVYRVRTETRAVEVLRFWNSRQSPASLD